MKPFRLKAFMRHFTFIGSIFVLVLFTAVCSHSAAEVAGERLQRAIRELEKLTEQTLKSTGVPGLAIAVVHDDNIVYLKGFGVRKAGEVAAVDADTVFQLASVSKPVATTVIAALVGEQRIRWDDRIIDHDPGFEMYDAWVTRQVTFRDFLCHRSGLPDHGGDLLEDLGYDRAWVLHQMRTLKPDSSFRSHFAYTNFGFTEAGVAAVMKLGKPWEEVSLEKLYKPLGMKSTSSRFADYAAAKNRAVGHVQVDGQWTAKYTRDADAQSPAGGVSSTARDMAQWLRLQLGKGKVDGKQIIDAAALAETHRAQIISHAQENPETDRSGFYGLGWNVTYDEHGFVRLGHSGGFDLGASTVVNLVPAEQLGIVVLCNSSPIGVPESLARSFCDVAIEGKVNRDWLPIFRQAFEAASKPNYGQEVDYRKPPAKTTAALANFAYTGKYSNDYYGKLQIVDQKNSLRMQIGAKPLTFELRHFDRDTFLYQPVGEMAGGLSAVTFTIGPDGRAAQIVLENLNVGGQGAFLRSDGGGENVAR